MSATAGAYVHDPLFPAGYGWCEAVIPAREDDAGGRYCYTKARFEREGHAVCGLHVNAGRLQWGAASGGDARSRDADQGGA